MKKHIFLFQVHKDVRLFERIINKLNSSNHFFIVNVDSKSKEKAEFESLLLKTENVLMISNKNIMHGCFSQISCTLSQLNYLLENNIKFDYVHTMSGQDYPCVDNEDLDDFFEENLSSYMYLDVEDPVTSPNIKDKYQKRMEHFYLNDYFNKKPFLKLHIAGIVNKIIKIIPRKCPFMDNIRGGWNWFSLSKPVVEYLIKYTKQNPKFVKRFKMTRYCDELFFPTILYYVRDELNINVTNSLRYIDWTTPQEDGNYPATLSLKDYDKIIKSNAIFCRKVTKEKSTPLMDKLDNKGLDYEL